MNTSSEPTYPYITLLLSKPSGRAKLSQAKKKADIAVTDVILFWLMMGHNIPWDFDTTLLFILMGICLDNNTHHI